MALRKKAAKRGRLGVRAKRPAPVDGIQFDSKAEGKRYGILKLRESAGEIGRGTIKAHPKFELTVNGILVGFYYADFSYTELVDERTGKKIDPHRRVVEDVKGRIGDTEVYRLKRKLVHAIHGIEVREVVA